jgi:hypothetical protein
VIRGPGRLGPLQNLFRLINANLPVPAFAVKAVSATPNRLDHPLLIRELFGRFPEGTDEEVIAAAFDEYRNCSNPGALSGFRRKR